MEALSKPIGASGSPTDTGADLTKEERARETVCNFMHNSRKYTEPYFKKADMIWKEYLNSRNEKLSPLQRANLKLPYAWTIVETFVPQIVEAFLGEKPYVAVEGRGVEDIQFEELLGKFLTYQLDEMDFFEKFVCFVKDLLIFGTAVAKTPWRFEDKTEYESALQIDTTTGDLKRVKTKVKKTVYDNPDFDPIQFWDFFPDWAASRPGDVNSMRGCVHRVWRTMTELEAKERKVNPDGTKSGIYTNLDKLRLNLSDKGYDAWAKKDEPKDPKGEKDYYNRDRALGLAENVKRKNKIEVWEYWGLFDVTGKGDFEEYVIAVANGDIAIRCDVNPYDGKFKPFVGGVNYPIPGEFYGVGDIEPVRSLIREGTALRNARLDQANMAVNRMWIVDRTAGINVRNLYSRSGGIILSNGIDGIKALEAPEVPGSSYREIQQLDFDIQNASAQINASQGASNVGRAFGRTATGVSFLQNYTASRITLKVRMIENLVMKKFGQNLLKLDRQFLTEDQWVRVMGDEQNPFKILPLDAFSGKYDFSTNGAIDRLNQKERQMNLQQNVLPFVQWYEQVRPGGIKIEDLAVQYFREFYFRDPAKLMNPPEQQQQFQQQMQQQATQQEMMLAEHNANSQAQAQAQLAMVQNQADAQRDESKFEQDIAKEVVKGVVNGATKRSEKPSR